MCMLPFMEHASDQGSLPLLVLFLYLLLLITHFRNMRSIFCFRWLRILMGFSFAFRNIAIQCSCHSANEGGQIIGQRMNTFKEESINFCPDHQNDREVVEEEQKDNGEADLSSIIFEKILNIERKEVEEHCHRYCRNYCTFPTITPANMLIWHNKVDGLKQQKSCNQTTNNTCSIDDGWIRNNRFDKWE